MSGDLQNFVITSKAILESGYGSYEVVMTSEDQNPSTIEMYLDDNGFYLFGTLTTRD